MIHALVTCPLPDTAVVVPDSWVARADSSQRPNRFNTIGEASRSASGSALVNQHIRDVHHDDRRLVSGEGERGNQDAADGDSSTASNPNEVSSHVTFVFSQREYHSSQHDERTKKTAQPPNGFQERAKGRVAALCADTDEEFPSWLPLCSRRSGLGWRKSRIWSRKRSRCRCIRGQGAPGIRRGSGGRWRGNRAGDTRI